MVHQDLVSDMDVPKLIETKEGPQHHILVHAILTEYDSKKCRDMLKEDRQLDRNLFGGKRNGD